MDVAIVGAGPVGATLASLLGGHGLDIGVFEARTAPSRDARTLALSEASRRLLEEVGGWPREGVTPIHTIHISQQGGPGRTLLDAAEQRLPALGYTVGYGALEAALEARLREAGVAITYGASCEAIALTDEAAEVRFAGGGSARARLLVLADGGANSTKIPGIAYTTRDYGQLALTAAVHCDRPHGGRAYERFTPDGPAALLPVDDRYALVWTAPVAEAERLRALPDADFLRELQAHFGDRAGRFVAAGPRSAFPLRLRTVNTPIALRTAIVGNAAQALHPIAGQGLNLGLRDAAVLADLVTSPPRREPGAAAMLDAYREARRRDAGRGVAFTDFLVSAFADPRRATKWGRGLALAALDLFPPARRRLAERMIHGAPGP